MWRAQIFLRGIANNILNAVRDKTSVRIECVSMKCVVLVVACANARAYGFNECASEYVTLS